jgi:hypothetical protein
MPVLFDAVCLPLFARRLLHCTPRLSLSYLNITLLFCTSPPSLSCASSPQAIDLARRLMLEFSAWVVRAHALRKVFVSVKGIYFQVTI